MSRKKDTLSHVDDITIPQWAVIIHGELEDRGFESYYKKTNYMEVIELIGLDDMEDMERQTARSLKREFGNYSDFYGNDSRVAPNATQIPVRPLLQGGDYRQKLMEDIELAEIIFSYLESCDNEGLQEAYEEAMADLKDGKGNYIHTQTDRWPIEDRLSEHQRIFAWAEYARDVKLKPSKIDCEIAALIEHGRYAFAIEFPGPQMGLAIGACLHNVLHGEAKGNGNRLIRLGKQAIKEFDEFICFATMHKIKNTMQIYQDYVKKGFEIMDGADVPEIATAHTSIAPSGPSAQRPADTQSVNDGKKRPQKRTILTDCTDR